MACTNCEPECDCGQVTEVCSCTEKDVSTDCIQYTGDDLPCTGITKGTILTNLITQLDTYICNRFNEFLVNLSLINIGLGAQVYRGISGTGAKEIRTIVSEDLEVLDIVENTDTIGVKAGKHRLELNAQEVALIVNSNQGDTTLSTLDLSGLSTGNTSVISNTVAGNPIATHSDGDTTTTVINETVTSLGFNSNTLTYTKEDNTTDTVDLSGYVNTDTISSITGNSATGNTIATHNNGGGASVNINETITSLSVNANVLTYAKEDGTTDTVDLSLYLDDTNLARLTSGTLNNTTGIATFTRDDASTFTVDLSALLGGAGGASYTINRTGTNTTTNNNFNLNLVEDGTTTDILTFVQPTGLEAIDEGSGIGWRLIGQDSNNYGNIGFEAVDLSVQTVVSTTSGATGIRSKSSGFNTSSPGAYSNAEGFGTIAHDLAQTVVGRHNELPTTTHPNSNSGISRSFSVGSGSSDTLRSNAFDVYKNGEIQIYPVKSQIGEGVTIPTPVAGMLRFNGNTNKHQGYDGTTWNDLY